MIDERSHPSTLPFVQVDAFADRAFGGNPAAVMHLSSWLDDILLQSIAAENNLSETAFLVPATDGESDFELRWFTPKNEVALCGHATLASGHVVLSADPARAIVRFATRKSGILSVSRAGGSRPRYDMALPTLAAARQPLPDSAAAMGGTVLETLWNARGYAVYVYANAAEIAGLSPDFAALRPLGSTVHIATAPGADSDMISRVFVPGEGIDEDPVTGSAHCVLAPYWAARLGRSDLTAVQASARGGRLNCRMDGDAVVLSGAAVTMLEGRFFLPA